MATFNAFERMQMRRKANKKIKEIKLKEKAWVTLKRFMKNVYTQLIEVCVIMGSLVRGITSLVWICKIPLTILVGILAWTHHYYWLLEFREEIKTPIIIMQYENTDTKETHKIENGSDRVDKISSKSNKWEGQARITAYSELDSCHYPDGRGGCLNAYGETILLGQAACPTTYQKGTEIEIEGVGNFICMDKTAEWVQDEIGKTFDIWMGYGEEGSQKAKNFGAQYKNVIIK